MKNKVQTAGLDDPKVFLGTEYNQNDYETQRYCEVWFDSGSTHSFVLEKEKI